MKHFFAVIILSLLTYQQSAAQCLTVKGMRSMFFKDMDAQDKYMGTKGFELIDGEEGKGYIWAKANKGLGRVSADIDDEGKVWQVDYHPPGVTCFTAIKSEVGALGLKKDAQLFKENFIYYFYSGPNYGVELYRITNAYGTAYYVAVMRKSEYQEEMDRVKAM
jgi:hypothetical protein